MGRITDRRKPFTPGPPLTFGHSSRVGLKFDLLSARNDPEKIADRLWDGRLSLGCDCSGHVPTSVKPDFQKVLPLRSISADDMTRIEDLDAFLDEAGLEIAPMPRAALFLAGKVFS